MVCLGISLDRGTRRTVCAHTLLIVATLTAGLVTTPARAQTLPERSGPRRPLPSSVILQGGNHAAVMQRVRVTRQYSLANVRSNPRVMIGEGSMDFTPMLNNPHALMNVAERLHAMPQQVQVQEESADVSEIEQGLIIHQVLTYRVQPGACSNPVSQAQLSRAGISCFTRSSPAQREASFSTPRDAHFVADPVRRRAAIVASQNQTSAEQADAAMHIAQLRAQLANPSQRAAISAQIGPAETARLSALSDDELEGEIINSATQQFEETAFVPRTQSTYYAHPPTNVMATPSADELATGRALLNGSLSPQSPAVARYPKLLRVIPQSKFKPTGGAPPPAGDQVTDLDLGEYTFLTGFTLGHDYEWSLTISTTINWCIVGCSSTYSVTIYAGFNYGFGLRFPIQTDLTYHNDVHPNNTATASVKSTFEPVLGNPTNFASTGIDPTQIFNGQELVAQVGADAGFSYNLPIVGSNNMGLWVGFDFTQLLPPPLQGGKFTPPAPGGPGLPTNFVFNQIDLLGGLLNFGAVGGQVFPAIQITLVSNKLQFTVNDEISKRNTTVSTGETVNLGTSPTGTHDSHFSFGNPVYNLAFQLTPGIEAVLFVDLAVWSDQWTFPVWLPQLSITIPSGGIDFGCHAGTTCVLDFQPEHQAGMTNGLLAELAAQGCTRKGNTMDCTTLQGYQTCQNAVKSNSILGVQSCNPGMVVSEENAADRTLIGGGCQHNGAIGNYLCTNQNGMLNLCKAMLKNGSVLSCGILVPTQTDQILKRGGCTPDPGKPASYTCPNSMLGLCQLYVKNQVIYSCQKK